MKYIEIKDVYNDVIKCSEMSDMIRFNDNSVVIIIPMALNQIPLNHFYEVEISNNREQILATIIDVDKNDKKVINYQKTNMSYSFIKSIKENSVIYINTYDILKPMLKIINRQEKLKELGI